MKRIVQPEILDSLPFNHPDALLNRRDLRNIHSCFRTFSWFSKTLAKNLKKFNFTPAILEMGAGEGDLIRFLEKKGNKIDGLDLAPSSSGRSEASHWFQSNIFTFPDWNDYPVIMANLILHQFQDTELKTLGERIQQSRLCIFNEPLRTQFHQVTYRGFARLMGMNHVSRHDGEVSIQAGFYQQELPLLLGLKNSDWEWRIESTITGFYRCVGTRK